jgi:hypothetical protein
MDSLTSIVMALATGAAAALKPTAEQAIKDGYAALKALITRKYAQVQVDQLEANPSSKNRRGVVEEELAAAGADQDVEVLHPAQALLEAIQSRAPETAAVIGMDLQDITEAALAIRRVTATGAGVRVEQVKLSGDITIEDVRVGGSREPPQRIEAAGAQGGSTVSFDHVTASGALLG